MFGFFNRTHNQGVGSRGRTVLNLERLELRDQPNAAPAIVNFSECDTGAGLFEISGQVVDQSPGGLVVTFGGGTSASGTTVVTNADGTFNDSIQLDGTDTEFLTATTVDGQGLASTPVAIFLNPTPAATAPAFVNYSAVQIGNGLFRISGQVVDLSPGGLDVTFSGGTSANGTTMATNADGTFGGTVQLQVSGADSGFLIATTVDGQGLASTPVALFVNPTPAPSAPDTAPAIADFSVVETGNGLFQVSGQVVDQSPGGLVVTFGGGTSASGTTVETNADGTFSDTVQLQVGAANAGFLTAMTVDGQGLASTPVAMFLDPIDMVSITAPPAPPAPTGPVITNFEAEEIGNGLFMISGQVIDQNPGGLVVTFGGSTNASGSTVVTLGDGTFTCIFRLPVNGTGAGTLTATTVDGQGLESPVVQVFLDPTPP